MSLCESIDTLSMAYLDEELAAEERREVELHLTECAGCRDHFEGERADQSLLRKALSAPPAPDLLRAKLARALDAEDRSLAKVERRRWTQWMLPGSAMLAAAAAIAVFVTVRPPDGHVGVVASDALKRTNRSLPLEVQGASTGGWVHQHFPTVQQPQFVEPGTQLLGARATAIMGHDAVMFSYAVSTGLDSFPVTVFAMEHDVTEAELGGDVVQVGNHTLRLIQQPDKFAVVYVDSEHRVYVFVAPTLTPDQLLQVVASSNLVGNN
ncbi:MAG: putative transrane anti-sigma factor [Myxococcales bacterium]|nr:putative transrane anti-sigma factor [Myxococcales bacterium]